MRSDLSDEELALFELLRPKSRKRMRALMTARSRLRIFYALRIAMHWRNLPARYGRQLITGSGLRRSLSAVDMR